MTLMQGIKHKLFGSSKSKSEEKQHIENISNDHPYVTESVIFRHTNNVEFINPLKGIRKVIIGEKNAILEFPGIEHYELVNSMIHEGNLSPNIRYRTELIYQQQDGRHLMLWEVQPDGRYWADEDGFGGENDAEIRLYTYIDEDGNFTAPFRIYDVGGGKFYGTDAEDLMERDRIRKKDFLSQENVDEKIAEYIELVISTFLKDTREQVAEKGRLIENSIGFDVLGTYNKAGLIIKSDSDDEVHLRLLVLRKGTDRAYNDFMKHGSLDEIYGYLENEDNRQEIIDSIWDLSKKVDEYYA